MDDVIVAVFVLVMAGLSLLMVALFGFIVANIIRIIIESWREQQ